MTTYTIPYGESSLSFEIPGAMTVEVLEPKSVSPHVESRELVEESLRRSSLKCFKNLSSAAIAINDKTRPVPHQHLLPPLLKKLETIGIPSQNITLIIATGAHDPMRPESFPEVVPLEILDRYRVVSHDCDDTRNLVNLGETERGTPVWINRIYADSALRVVVGNIEPHQFQGFSGGVKSAVIGLAGRETINANHAWLTDPRARLGAYQDNPARQDVEEIGKLLGVHFALNTVLNDQKEILYALAGPPQEIMTNAIPLVRDLYELEVAEPFDFLIVSPGGHPKDINLYQAQKALTHAALVAREGATILLAAACPEGVGDDAFSTWMREDATLEDILARFQREGFQVGPHKAYLFARESTRLDLYLNTSLAAQDLDSLHLRSVEDLQTFLNARLPGKGRIGIIPYANATIPKIKD